MKIGIVGNGGIVKQAIQCFKEAEIECTALWCRTRSKGEAIFDKEKVYVEYDAFLQQTTFDTVYIGVINSEHYHYAKLALEAKKNVIVEKPFTTTYEEAKELVDLAYKEGVYLFEAILSRYSPIYRKLPQYLPQLGNIKLIQANYSQYSSRYDAYLKGEVLPAFDPKLQGGALNDLNVYNIHFVVGLLGRPLEVHYYSNKGFNGVDTSGTLILTYPTCLAVCTAAKDSRSTCGTLIQGDKGTIEIHSRPGVLENVTLNRKEEIKGNDVHPMTQEFIVMQDILGKQDYKTMKKWLEDTLITMEVLEQARV